MRWEEQTDGGASGRIASARYEDSLRGPIRWRLCDTIANIMTEPPILPDDSQLRPATSVANEFENPYAPTATAATAKTAQSLDLPPAYWVALLVAFGGFALLSYVAPGLGVPAVFALVSAAIRVPLLQRRLPTMSTVDRPNPLVMLLTSWGFSLV
ncbi:MAG: hypothetical protein KDA51_00110, partial [Planctomycetales bacterium]|nr:hypothetical protein [Planctomycetales bacterium]